MFPKLGNPDLGVPDRMTYPVNDVAVLLGISDRKVWSLIYEGKLPTIWIEGRRLVRADVLEAYIESRTDTKPDFTKVAAA